MLITNAFTCTGPYAILIMLGIKRVENRNMMPCLAKGRCAVGCSKSFCKEEFGAFVQWAFSSCRLMIRAESFRLRYLFHLVTIERRLFRSVRFSRRR